MSKGGNKRTTHRNMHASDAVLTACATQAVREELATHPHPEQKIFFEEIGGLIDLAENEKDATKFRAILDQTLKVGEDAILNGDSVMMNDVHASVKNGEIKLVNPGIRLVAKHIGQGFGKPEPGAIVIGGRLGINTYDAGDVIDTRHGHPPKFSGSHLYDKNGTRVYKGLDMTDSEKAAEKKITESAQATDKRVEDKIRTCVKSKGFDPGF